MTDWLHSLTFTDYETIGILALLASLMVALFLGHTGQEDEEDAEPATPCLDSPRPALPRHTSPSKEQA